MIVKVKEKYINEWKHQQDYYEVYNIRNDRAGYPMFLIYNNGQWVYKSAKYFEPLEKVFKVNNYTEFKPILKDERVVGGVFETEEHEPINFS